MKHLIPFFFLFTSIQLLAQDIPIGTWREHLPYTMGESVAEVGGFIYCSTGQGLFRYDRNDKSLLRMGKVSGLSDIGIRTIHSHHQLGILLIAYENANIDLIRPDKSLVNIPDIKRKTSLGKKTINRIIFHGNLAYLACGFGIVVLDLEKDEFQDTYFIGPSGSQIEVFDIAFNDSMIFAATENGVYMARTDAPNLADFNAWSKDMDLLYPNAPYSFILHFHDKIYSVQSGTAGGFDTLWVNDGMQWDSFAGIAKQEIFGLKIFRDQIMIVSQGDIDLYDDSGQLLERIYTYSPGVPSPHDALIGNDNQFWIADLNLGLVRCYNTWNCEAIHPDGPLSSNSAALAFRGDKLWVATGGVNYSWNNFYRTEGLFSFNGNSWKNYNRSNIPALDTIYDIISLAIDPSNEDHVFAGSWGNGLLELKDGKLVKVYNTSNSSLQSPQAFYFVGVAGMVFDGQNNLWVSNSLQPRGLSMLSPDGIWRSFNLSPAINEEILGSILIDDYDQKWVILPRGNGILVFNDNHTPDIPGDDQKRKLSSSAGNGNLPSTNVLCAAIDRDGEIWIGTDKGVAVIYSPGNVFTGNNFDAQKVLVVYDGYTQYLLESENVTTIAVDGANRKWIGTERAGVFLLSDDGTTELKHFTADNSPLLSDNIFSIVIDHQSGEVYFGTDKGIISYRGTATWGEGQHQNTYAFPNPVPPSHNGPIAIRGLVDKADVKITDIAGNIVFSTKAFGGQAIWDGKNFQGQKVHTGVYLVFSSNTNDTGYNPGEETLVTKILFIH